MFMPEVYLLETAVHLPFGGFNRGVRQKRALAARASNPPRSYYCWITKRMSLVKPPELPNARSSQDLLVPKLIT